MVKQETMEIVPMRSERVGGTGSDLVPFAQPGDEWVFVYMPASLVPLDKQSCIMEMGAGIAPATAV